METKTNTRDINGQKIIVTASRVDAGSHWVISVVIVLPSGKTLPPMKDLDHSYPSLEEAFEAGFKLAE